MQWMWEVRRIKNDFYVIGLSNWMDGVPFIELEKSGRGTDGKEPWRERGNQEV